MPEKQANPEPLAALEEEYQKLGKLVEELKTQLPRRLFTGHRLEVYEALIAAGYEAALAEKLLTACGEQETLELIWQALEKELAKGLKSASLPFPEEEPVVLALVGPTGVGKTTTIAKLAALYSLKHGYKVGLATVDTYRIGAVEQLRTYAEILDVPLEVALSTTELERGSQEAPGELRGDLSGYCRPQPAEPYAAWGAEIISAGSRAGSRGPCPPAAP